MTSNIPARIVLALVFGLLGSSYSSGAFAEPTDDAALRQMRMAEMDALESRKESDKKPPREVRKAQHEAAKAAKKDPKRGP